METWKREIIIENIRPKLNDYELKLRKCFESDNKKGMETWINQIKQTIDFIDGIEQQKDWLKCLKGKTIRL